MIGAIIGAAVTVALSLFAVVYKFGRLTQAVETLTDKVESFAQIECKVDENRERIVALEAIQGGI